LLSIGFFIYFRLIFYFYKNNTFCNVLCLLSNLNRFVFWSDSSLIKQHCGHFSHKRSSSSSVYKYAFFPFSCKVVCVSSCVCLYYRRNVAEVRAGFLRSWARNSYTKRHDCKILSKAQIFLWSNSEEKETTNCQYEGKCFPKWLKFISNFWPSRWKMSDIDWLSKLVSCKFQKDWFRVLGGQSF